RARRSGHRGRRVLGVRRHGDHPPVDHHLVVRRRRGLGIRSSTGRHRVMTRPIAVSAYPLSPAFVNWDPALEAEVLYGLVQLEGVAALEVPWIDGIHPHDSEWFLANAPAVDLAITPLPFVMRRIAAHEGYG